MQITRAALMQIIRAALSQEELISIGMLTAEPEYSLHHCELLPSTQIMPRHD